MKKVDSVQRQDRQQEFEFSRNCPEHEIRCLKTDARASLVFLPHNEQHFLKSSVSCSAAFVYLPLLPLVDPQRCAKA